MSEHAQTNSTQAVAVTERKKQPNLKLRAVIKIIFFLALAVLVFLTFWAVTTYDDSNLSEIVYHLHLPMGGAGGGITLNAALWTLIPAFLSTALFAILVWPLVDNSQATLAIRKRFRWKTWLVRGSVILLLAVELFMVEYFLDITDFISAQFTHSTFIEDNFVDPKEVKLVAPDNKRNLIFIYLESVESTYMDREAGGSMDGNRLENLTRLALENINFSHHEKLGGFRNSVGTSWTVGACFGATTGLPLKLPLKVNLLAGVKDFFPGVTALGDILKEEGYINVLMLGCDSTFGGQSMFYDQHGDHLIKDYNYAKKSGLIPQDYFVFWGYEDYKLFDFARKELTSLAKREKPFSFTLFTMDTHFEDGHLCKYCPDKFADKYSNVIACSDKLATELVRWIQEQDFYENTTVIVVGDHLTMDKDFCQDIPREERAIYNCFLNSVVRPYKTKNREFMATDLFPTTLAAMGYKIEGERLGLGTNLFSNRKTLAEELGVEELDEKFEERSDFYEQKFILNQE